MRGGVADSTDHQASWRNDGGAGGTNDHGVKMARLASTWMTSSAKR